MGQMGQMGQMGRMGRMGRMGPIGPIRPIGPTGMKTMAKISDSIFLIAPLRTPIGKFGGGLSSLTAAQLGIASATATIARSGIDPNAIDEVIFGNARQAAVGPNVARKVANKGG